MDDVLKGWIGLRTRTRGFGLPFFASPLIPAALFGAIGGDERIVLGSALGFGLSVLAARVLRRGRKGDADWAAWIMAVGTGLAGVARGGARRDLPVRPGGRRVLRNPHVVPGPAGNRAAAAARSARAAGPDRAGARPPCPHRGLPRPA